MAEPMNANTSTGAANGQDASARISKALQYKAAQAAAAAAAPEEQPAPIADDVTGATELRQMLLRMQSNGDAGDRGGAVSASGGSQGAAGPGHIQRGLPDSSRRPIKSMPVSAPQRVQSAMQAALEYRQRQSAALSAKVSTAAADAAQPPTPVKTTNVKRPEGLARVLAAARASKAKKAQPPVP